MKMEPAKSFVADRLVIDLRNPSLEGLSYALRHLETLLADFAWYYGDYSTCAMAVACMLWPRIGLHDPHNMTRAFGISTTESVLFFCSDYGRASKCYVTPEMVADRIDEYRARNAA
jgi:hypothetical protein